MSFATNTTLAAVAYRGGATPLAVLIARAGAALLLLWLLLVRRRVALTLPPARRRAALALGLIFAGYSWAVLVAIQYLPVGLVVATFYVFPLLVGVVEWASGRQRYDRSMAVALLIAFGGIVLALDVFGASLDRTGIVLVLLAALGVTVVMTQSASVRGNGDSRPVTLHMLGAALAVYVLLAASGVAFALPHTAQGWYGFLGAPLFYTFGIVTVFMVLGELGPVRTSLTMNIEPVTSVVLGYLLLGQALAWSQLAGIALVIAAVLLVQSAQLRPAPVVV